MRQFKPLYLTISVVMTAENFSIARRYAELISNFTALQKDAIVGRPVPVMHEDAYGVLAIAL
jgi:hypothetical protein